MTTTKKTLRERTIKELFEVLGAEELIQKPSVPTIGKAYTWHAKDFSEGGEMEKFAEYTMARYEREFVCLLYVC